MHEQEQPTRPGHGAGEASSDRHVHARVQEHLIRLPDAVGEAGVDDLGELRAAVFAAFGDLLGAIVAEVWAALRCESWYRSLSPADAEQVRDALRRSVETFLTCLAEDRGLDGQERAFYAALGAERAWMGIPLETVRLAFQLGFDHAYRELDRLSGQHRGPAGPHLRAWFTSRLITLFPQAWTLVEEAHEAAHEGQTLPRDHARQRLVEDVIHGLAEEHDLERQLELLGVQAVLWRALVVMGRKGEEDGVATAAEGLASVLSGALHGVVHDEPVPHVALLVPHRADGDGEVAQLGGLLHGREVALVVGVPEPLRACGVTVRCLQSHLPVIARVGDGQGVWPARKVMRYAMLDGPSRTDAVWFVDDVLGVLAEPGLPAWEPLRTLRDLYEHRGNVKAAAAATGKAERTLREHLRAIGRLLGVDWSDWGDRFDVELALLAMRAHALEPPFRERS